MDSAAFLAASEEVLGDCRNVFNKNLSLGGSLMIEDCTEPEAKPSIILERTCDEFICTHWRFQKQCFRGGGTPFLKVLQNFR